MIKKGLHFLGNLLSRETSSGEVIREIDGLRFLAIFLVIIHHTIGLFLYLTGRIGTQEHPGWVEAAGNNL